MRRISFIISCLFFFYGNSEGQTNTSDSGCKCGLAKRATRIVGGVHTEANEYPWQVGFSKNEMIVCGGSLISNLWILSAAHCFPDESTTGVDVLLGVHNQMNSASITSLKMEISEVKNHWKYANDMVPNFDFSLVKLTEQVDFSKYPHIRPICLPIMKKHKYNNKKATVTGWGWGVTQAGGSSSDVLREASVKVISNKKCLKRYPYPLTGQMLCAKFVRGEEDSGYGPGYDSGGPLVTSGSGDGVTAGQNYEQIGVVSWGLESWVYARVTKQLRWIHRNIKESETCPRD